MSKKKKKEKLPGGIVHVPPTKPEPGPRILEPGEMVYTPKDPRVEKIEELKTDILNECFALANGSSRNIGNLVLLTRELQSLGRDIQVAPEAVVAPGTSLEQ